MVLLINLKDDYQRITKLKVTKTILSQELKKSEYEELIHLRAEITYIKAENEVIKKRLP